MDLNKLRDRAYETACSHGWHDEELSDETYLMLVITEIAEAVNADREGKHAFRKMFEENAHTPQPHPERHWKFCFEQFIKDSVEDELADTVIRCLDFAGLHGLDLQKVKGSMQKTSDAEGFLGGKTFAEVAFGICREITMAANHKCAVRIVIECILDYCRYKEIEIEWFITQKMKYNELRPYKHGDKKY